MQSVLLHVCMYKTYSLIYDMLDLRPRILKRGKRNLNGAIGPHVGAVTGFVTGHADSLFISDLLSLIYADLFNRCFFLPVSVDTSAGLKGQEVMNNLPPPLTDPSP